MAGPDPTGAPDALLAGLTDEQRDAVTTDAAPLLVLAGAGSGKTRVLTRRIAWRAATDRLDPRRVLAVTFTRKAAAELGRRLRDLGVAAQVTAGTFHALAYAQLRRHWLDQGRRAPKLLDRKTRLLVALLDGGDAGTAAPVAREIEWAQAQLVTPGEYEGAARAGRRRGPVPLARIADVYAAYEREKHRRGLVDFDDLLVACAAALEDDPELAAATQWRFRHLFVDELQDLNPSQFRLLRAWLGSRDDLCAVGDDEQAIYGFGGADARYVAEFSSHFGRPEHPVTVVRLTANFRSTPQILALANAVLSPGAGQERRLRATGHDGPAPEIVAYPDDAEEAAGVARLVASLQREGTPYRSMAVLARTNAQCSVLEEALRAARIPALVRGSQRFLDLPVVQQTLHAMSEAQSREPGLGFKAHLDEAAALRETTLGSSDPEALSVLLELGREYAATEGETADVEGFTAFATAAMRNDDPAPRGNAVDVLTFHRAKGLEWPVVFVTGLEDGFVPISHATTEGARAEERRLLHVALTRAGQRLYLSWAHQRRFGDRVVARERSPFLPTLEQHLPPPAPAGEGDGGAGTGREVLQAVAAELREHAPPAPLHERPRDELWHALVEWREHRARAAGVPVVAIVDDEALEAIHRQRPGDEEALGTVPGLGPSRVARLGAEIVDLVARYALDTTHDREAPWPG